MKALNTLFRKKGCFLMCTILSKYNCSYISEIFLFAILFLFLFLYFTCSRRYTPARSLDTQYTAGPLATKGLWYSITGFSLSFKSRHGIQALSIQDILSFGTQGVSPKMNCQIIRNIIFRTI